MTDPASSPQQDPLAALEDILKDAQADSGAESVTPPPTSAADPTPAHTDAAATEAEKKREIEAMTAEQAQKDAQKLQQEIQNLKEIGTSPQEQARQEQNSQQQALRDQQAEDQEGYEIRQLDHTKIPGTS